MSRLLLLGNKIHAVQKSLSCVGKWTVYGGTAFSKRIILAVWTVGKGAGVEIRWAACKSCDPCPERNVATVSWGRKTGGWCGQEGERRKKMKNGEGHKRHPISLRVVNERSLRLQHRPPTISAFPCLPLYTLARTHKHTHIQNLGLYPKKTGS